ncbi:NAD(P)/FAD-dependent oxidoreductase [Vibrio palustris]|uniref:Protoporphyrinogen oxidase n=1 Tax=Vibrio palustris TaxID=1918946 RepID=A0A1R4B318_9VIBR|nr:NAD(P)/FAD-dependent oxidoreductase [Vibrio palustris]SJL83312.1 protoporphyrinogen oxidase [Vibrio palustris]
MKVAIIGAGISGLTTAYYLQSQHDITVFEANDYIGGHTATVDVNVQEQPYAVDTGFIVYNDRTYPNFMHLMQEIGVKGKATEMSFSVKNDGNGLEYNGHTIGTLFAQKRNLLNVKFYRFIADILRFNQLAKAAIDEQSRVQTLDEFLDKHGFNAYFCENYILPMGAAIWSSSLADMRQFPLDFFLRFFLNHGLLDVTNRPQWYVIEGGSRSYIDPLTQGFSDRIRLNSPVSSVVRSHSGVTVTSNGVTEQFDEVVFACHSDQAKRMLSDATSLEQEILGAIPYQANDVTLHTDTTILPKHQSAWASWNYWLAGEKNEEKRLPAVTYNMNILQQIDAPHTFCVTLNRDNAIDPTKILRQFTYHHPVFTVDGLRAQRRRNEINGHQHVWFCGAYWYNGFHEDGVRSALDVVTAMNAYMDSTQSDQGAA